MRYSNKGSIYFDGIIQATEVGGRHLRKWCNILVSVGNLAAFSDAVKILKGDPKRGKAIMALEYPTMAPATNDEAYAVVSQIWTNDGHMTEAQARATFAYLQPKGTQDVDFASTFTNEFVPK